MISRTETWRNKQWDRGMRAAGPDKHLNVLNENIIILL